MHHVCGSNEHACMQKRTSSRDVQEIFSWFLPLWNATKDHGNVPMLEYFGSNILETAEVSDAAPSHISMLKEGGIPPEEWRDSFSRPVLIAAVTRNYIKLAQWLVDEGVPVVDDAEYRCAVGFYIFLVFLQEF